MLTAITRVNDQVVAEFKAELKGYTMTDYQETEVLRASVQAAAPRWTINMMDAAAPTEYDMKYNMQLGTFEIVPRA